MKSLLQERNAAQPQINQQPLLQTADSSVSADIWVSSLRHDVQAMPRPQLPDLDPFELDPVVDVYGIPPVEISDTGQDATLPDSTLSLLLNDIHCQPTSRLMQRFCRVLLLSLMQLLWQISTYVHLYTWNVLVNVIYRHLN